MTFEFDFSTKIEMDARDLARVRVTLKNDVINLSSEVNQLKAKAEALSNRIIGISKAIDAIDVLLARCTTVAKSKESNS